MKTKLYLQTFIPCVCSMLMLLACHKSDINSNDPKERGDQVFARATCNDCSDCCCYVELDGSTSANLQFCGTANGASACMGDETCGTGTSFMGGGQFITLSTTNNRKVFCMGLSAPFWIKNLDAMNDVDLVISCQAESGLPQTLQVHLEPNGTMGDQLYFDTNSECEVDECP